MKLAYREWNGGPRLAVLVHGLTSNAGGWARVAPALVERGYRVLAPELRGHGESPRPREGYTPLDMARDLAETVPAEPDLLLGHSLGGVVALVAAAEGLLRPRRLVLEDPAIKSRPPEEMREFIAERQAQPRDAETLLAQNPRWSRVDAEEKALAYRQLDWEAMYRIAEAAPWDEWHRLGSLSCPTLFLLADPSVLVPPERARAVAERLGGRSVRAIEGAGHDIHRERWEEFLAELWAWLEAPAE